MLATKGTCIINRKGLLVAWYTNQSVRTTLSPRESIIIHTKGHAIKFGQVLLNGQITDEENALKET